MNTAAMDTARENTKFALSRARLVRKPSVEAAPTFADASIDWIFIDGDHTYDGAIADLKAWYPKVRRGGLVSGDDYGDGTSARLQTAIVRKASIPTLAVRITHDRLGRRVHEHQEI